MYHLVLLLLLFNSLLTSILALCASVQSQLWVTNLDSYLQSAFVLDGLKRQNQLPMRHNSLHNSANFPEIMFGNNGNKNISAVVTGLLDRVRAHNGH